jgi:ATP-binding cassette subfamily B protein
VFWSAGLALNQSDAGDLEKHYRPNCCGPISLYVVCCAYGIETTIEELSTLSGMDTSGTTIAGLVRAAEKKGLEATAFQSTIRHLQGLDGPVVIDFPKGHFCVLFRWKDGKALIVDPPHKNRLVPPEELEQHWGKHTIQFTKTESSK